MLRNALVQRKPTSADRVYDQAMAASTDLIEKMRKCSEEPSPIRAMMADIWLQHHNVPYVTTVFQSVQEMSAATAYKTVDDDSERKT